ncbi:MAG: peroxiredoxin-like family protein [Pseudomonadota bacterium]
MLMPRQKTPDLTLPTLDHGGFDLAQDGAERGVVICFYRGLHCPICANYLTEFEKRVDDFAERGVKTIAVSSDTEERARAMVEKISATKLRFAYGLELSKAREWGLYISTSRGKTSASASSGPTPTRRSPGRSTTSIAPCSRSSTRRCRSWSATSG